MRKIILLLLVLIGLFSAKINAQNYAVTIQRKNL